MSGLALPYGAYVLARWLSNDSHPVTGWSSTVIVTSLPCSINMLMTGILGHYIDRIHAEEKRRPRYVVAMKLGFEREEDLARALERACFKSRSSRNTSARFKLFRPCPSRQSWRVRRLVPRNRSSLYLDLRSDQFTKQIL
jgi:hypothetical protein